MTDEVRQEEPQTSVERQVPRPRWYRKLRTSDVIATLALLISIPAAADLIVRWFAKPEITIYPPYKLEVRADLVLLAEPSVPNTREFSPANSYQRAFFVVAPVSYFRTGRGDLLVGTERISLTLDGTELKWILVGTYETEIVPAETRHWWLGEIKPWLPVILTGDAVRSKEVVFGTEDGCAEHCRFSTFVEALAARPGATLTARLEAVTHLGTSYVAQCVLRADDLAPAEGLNADQRRFYLRSGRCSSLGSAPSNRQAS